MTGVKTNERPGTRAQVRHVRMSAYKAREVLNLIRGKDVETAREILRFSERDAAIVVGKLLDSAIANAEHNDALPADEIFVSACYADEGKTLRRFRPRARGRATRIRKRSCHITIIVSRMGEDELAKRRARDAARPGSRAARRAGQEAAEEKKRRGRRRREARAEHDHEHDHDHEDEPTAAEVAEAEDDAGIVDQQAAAAAEAEAAEEQGADVTDVTGEDEAGDSAAEEAGIVDQQDAAIEAADDAGDADATKDEEQ